MNRRAQNNNLPENREIQNRFTAYVQVAMRNTRSTYYSRKMAREARETVCDDTDDFEITDSGDIQDAVFSLNMDRIRGITQSGRERR